MAQVRKHDFPLNSTGCNDYHGYVRPKDLNRPIAQSPHKPMIEMGSQGRWRAVAVAISCRTTLDVESWRMMIRYWFLKYVCF